MTIRRVALALALTALVPFLAACGGGSENASEPLPTTAPTLTVPGETKTPEVDNSSTTEAETTTTDDSSTATSTAPTQTTATPSNPSAPSGGAQAPATGGATPDTPDNDQPPAEGSPAEKFEDFCKDNPGAC